MRDFATAHAMRKRMKKMCSGGKMMADGGFVSKEEAEYDPVEQPMPKMNEAAEHEDMDMIKRIMAQHFSKGGQVANDVGVAEADELPAEYDDLVLRDNDMSDADYTAANSGDEHGNAAMDERNDDLIARIMASRRKKDRLPRPA